MREKVSNPMQYASGYTLHLYCDSVSAEHTYNPDTRFWEYTGETFAGCARAAKKAGWVIRTKTRTATCPHCRG